MSVSRKIKSSIVDLRGIDPQHCQQVQRQEEQIQPSYQRRQFEVRETNVEKIVKKQISPQQEVIPQGNVLIKKSLFKSEEVTVGNFPKPMPTLKKAEDLKKSASLKEKTSISIIMKKHSSRYNIIGGMTISIFVLALFIFTSLTSVDIFFWTFFIAIFYWHIDSRVSIGGALIFLIIIPILLIAESNLGYINGEILAEEVAVWVYFFLVIGVIKQIWEYRMESLMNNKIS